MGLESRGEIWNIIIYSTTHCYDRELNGSLSRLGMIKKVFVLELTLFGVEMRWFFSCVSHKQIQYSGISLFLTSLKSFVKFARLNRELTMPINYAWAIFYFKEWLSLEVFKRAEQYYVTKYKIHVCVTLTF